MTGRGKVLGSESTTPWAPHAVLPAARLPGEGDSWLHVSKQTSAALPNTTLLTSCPRCMWEELQSKGLPGVQQWTLALRVQDLLCFPFKEKLKRLHGANAACHSSASGDTAMVQTQEREDRAHHLIWSWQPSTAGTNLHCVRMLPVSPFAAHMVCGAGGTGTMTLLASFP